MRIVDWNNDTIAQTQEEVVKLLCEVQGEYYAGTVERLKERVDHVERLIKNLLMALPEDTLFEVARKLGMNVEAG